MGIAMDTSPWVLVCPKMLKKLAILSTLSDPEANHSLTFSHRVHFNEVEDWLFFNIICPPLPRLLREVLRLHLEVSELEI